MLPLFAPMKTPIDSPGKIKKVLNGRDVEPAAESAGIGKHDKTKNSSILTKMLCIGQIGTLYASKVVRANRDTSWLKCLFSLPTVQSPSSEDHCTSVCNRFLSKTIADTRTMIFYDRQYNPRLVKIIARVFAIVFSQKRLQTLVQ
ncbi:hypothetical protein Tcan_15718 [Toxocara canis]|uniref:Uncharacterized protein n=1 Tax=Toxocara canis TaxID=6265 RepID=A0A0B2VLJ1_TOXCA|nr:hypothetical protein Tcan_15718 [Toxocara canis]